MRELILKRIHELANANHNFSKDSFRWKSFIVNNDNDKIHLSDVDFNTFDDEKLLKIYEKIVRRHYAQG